MPYFIDLVCLGKGSVAKASRGNDDHCHCHYERRFNVTTHFFYDDDGEVKFIEED